MILLVGISLILGVSGAVADERTRPDAEKTIDNGSIDEYDNVVGRDLPDLPDDMAGIVSIDNPEEETDEYDNVVGSDLPDEVSHIVSVDEGDFESDDDNDDETDQSEEFEETEEPALATLPVAIGVGLAGIGVIGLIFIKRR